MLCLFLMDEVYIDGCQRHLSLQKLTFHTTDLTDVEESDINSFGILCKESFFSPDNKSELPISVDRTELLKELREGRRLRLRSHSLAMPGNQQSAADWDP